MLASAIIFARMKTRKILRGCNLECDAVFHGPAWSAQGPNQRAGG